MKKLFYIEHVQRNVTVVKRYAVEAETFEEAIALHDDDFENFHGEQVWEPEHAHMVEKLADGWNLHSTEELEQEPTPEEREAQRLRTEQYRKENGIDDFEEVECSYHNCGEMTFEGLTEEQKCIITMMVVDSDGQSDFKRGFYWQIDEQYATDNSDPRLFITPKDFYDKEKCLADFSYGAEQLLDSFDYNVSEMCTEEASSYSFACSAATMSAILKKYEPFFEEKVILAD